MSSMENIEVYIPKGACVKNIPFQSLSRSMARKISVHLCRNRSEAPEKQIVTCISPVELREKAAADGSEMHPLGQRSAMTKITPGQFWLPVVSSSVKAYKILKSILPAHKPSIELAGSETEAASLPISKSTVLQKNSFIVFNHQIFLSVKKSRGRRVSSQNVTSPSAFPVFSKQQHQQNAPPSCQTQDPDPPRPQQRKAPDQTVIRDTEQPTLLQKVSEVAPKQICISKKGQKAAGTTSDLTNNPPKPSGDQEPHQETSSLLTSNSETNILHRSQSTSHTSSEVSEEPKAAGGEGETHEHLETAEFLPRVESCLAFDFQQLAKEEKISHLRARLKRKEAALSILKSKSTDQV